MARHIDAHEYAELARRCRAAPPEIRREMRARLRTAARIGADAAKMAARAMPTLQGVGQPTSRRGGGHGHHGAATAHRAGGTRNLRAQLAADISVKVDGTDVRIIQGSAGLSGRSARGLPYAIDRGGTWSHPVFGHGPDVRQIGYQYFRRTINEKKDEMTREVATVLRTVERTLT